MYSISNGKVTIARLNSIWHEFITAKGLTGELAYRLGKLGLKLDTIADKIFVKTVKAHDILFECETLTEQFKSAFDRSNNKALHLLTRLETHIDDLVKQTHAFRIKAG